jgi:hypothetical protein
MHYGIFQVFGLKGTENRYRHHSYNQLDDHSMVDQSTNRQFAKQFTDEGNSK